VNVDLLIYGLILIIAGIFGIFYLRHLVKRDRYRERHPEWYKEKPSILFNSQYKCKEARTVTEATVLIEDGFEYVCDVDEVKLFRKKND